MYINDVLRTCDVLCPNEYSDEEKYMWCDEISAMIMSEHLKTYDKVTLEAGEDGSYLLPEGITFEMVDRVIDGAREIDKRDFRSYGIEYYYGKCGRFVFPTRNRVRGSIDVVYLKKHEPIRTTEIQSYNSEFKHNEFTFPKTMNLAAGDTVTIRAENKEFDEIPILEIHFVSIPIVDENGKIIGWQEADYSAAVVADETFKDLLGDKTIKRLDCTIEHKRIVTDETVCGAPYDRMYVDYVNAQICYYQRDFDTYNQHMNLFNQRLAAYQAWLQQRRTQDKDGKMVNWI